MSSVLERIFDIVFQLALEHNQSEVVKLLIEKGADINKKNDSINLNAVQIAAYNNNVDTFKALIKYENADLNVVEDEGKTLL